jgi:hypothetical protein
LVGRKKRNRKIGNGVGKKRGKIDETRIQTSKEAEPANLSQSECGPQTDVTLKNCYR